MATVGLSLVRQQAVNIKAPRFLHCEFPLGRPLGRPNDGEFQTDVLRRAFALLDRSDVPVIEDHSEVIDDESQQAATCTLPPLLITDQHPAVDEALALVPAYRRHVAATDGRTAFGRVTTIDELGETVGKLVAIGEGASIASVGFDDDSVRAAAHDIQAFYEEAGLAISDHVPAARQLETWLYEETEGGHVLRAASQALEKAGADHDVWFYMLPGSRR